MNPKELMLGNYLQDVVSQRVLQVYGLDESVSVNIIHYEAGMQVGDLKVEPIPLTEKWMARLCFTDVNNGYRATGAEVVYEKNNIRLWLKWPSAWVFERFNTCEILYVHQLQNIYHALIGEELTWTK